MKQFLLIAVVSSICSTINAQDNYAKDVSSLDNILAALYDVISGDKDVKRDWDRFNNLFTVDAQLIPTRKNDEGELALNILTPSSYVEKAGAYLEANGFHEIEINRVGCL